jgi:tetratricopeptide (TPR) repeat protein
MTWRFPVYCASGDHVDKPVIMRQSSLSNRTGPGCGLVTKRQDDSHHSPEPRHNALFGPVYGSVVQARDVHGDVHLHRPTLPAPSQLPPQPRLVDRQADLAELNALRDRSPDASVTVLVTGSAGVGKTALALSWAHAARSHYPDGQLFADLGGHSSDAPPVSPHAVLGDFLFSLGIAPDLIPGELARRAALFRSVTHERRILVLLDDALTAAQVRPLLPASPGSFTIVTSRYRLGALLARGAHGVHVDRLDTYAGVALIAEVLGDQRVDREREAAERLVALCAHLPLALSVAAGRLAARPSWPLGEMVAALSEEQRLAELAIGDDMVVRSALDLSYQALGAEAARLYRLLGLVPGETFGGDAAAALGGIPAVEARSLLGVLTDANLLTDTTGGRYRFHHTLIRLHAREVSRAEDSDEFRETALGRLFGWYLDTAAKAERRLRPYRGELPRDAEPPPIEPTDFGGPEDALGWMEAERVNLQAAITAAHERGRSATAWQLADAMWALYLYRGHYAERVAVEEAGLAAARRCEDQYAEAKMLNRLGLSLHGLGREEEAVAYFEGARELWKRLGKRDREAGSLRRLGMVSAAMDDRDAAISAFLSACAIYRELGADRKAALALIDLANVLLGGDRAPDALTYLEEARRLLTVDDPYNRARLQVALGRAYIAIGKYQRSSRELDAALETMTALGASTGQAEVLEVLGELASRTGRFHDARLRFEQCLSLLGGDTETAAHARVRARLQAIGPPR